MYPMAIWGLISLKTGSRYYSLLFQDLGWMAADLVQYLGDIIESDRREAAILKLLGLTMRVSREKPERRGEHWVFIDLDARRLETNSEMLRLAVRRKPAPEGSAYSDLSMQKIYQVLDRHDFTVELYE